MNEIHRIGKGDEYLELCADWQDMDYTKFVWWFQNILGGDKYSNKRLIEAMEEVKESIKGL